MLFASTRPAKGGADSALPAGEGKSALGRPCAAAKTVPLRLGRLFLLPGLKEPSFGGFYGRELQVFLIIPVPLSKEVLS